MLVKQENWGIFAFFAHFDPQEHLLWSRRSHKVGWIWIYVKRQIHCCHMSRKLYVYHNSFRCMNTLNSINSVQKVNFFTLFFPLLRQKYNLEAKIFIFGVKCFVKKWLLRNDIPTKISSSASHYYGTIWQSHRARTNKPFPSFHRHLQNLQFGLGLSSKYRFFFHWVIS